MCLILFAYQMHPEYKLIVAANRDEFYKRPTAQAHFWEDRPEILAGRDLKKMGTWMGVTTSGRFAALTNYRDPKEETAEQRSRGEVVADALTFQGDIKTFMEQTEGKSNLYPGYNLLVGDQHELYYYSNVGKKLQAVEPGVHGLSNHLLNTPWPKVVKGKAGLEKIISDSKADLIEELFSLLQNADPAREEELPNTGVSLEWERMLSPLFIQSEHYGTRSSSVMLMSDRNIVYVERVFANGEVSDRRFEIEL